MKRKDETYKKWLEKVKSTEPVLDKPEELTNDILNSISVLSAKTFSPGKKTEKKNTNRVLKLVSEISGLVAAFLLCFLISETVFFPWDKQAPEQSHMGNSVWQINISSLTDGWNQESSLLEKSHYLSEQWKEYKKERSERKTFFLSKRISIETITHKN